MNQEPSQDTPEKLLQTAQAILHLNSPNLMRVVVLEAVTALETYIQVTIFPKLENRLGETFTKFLKSKTTFDFDSRLSVLVEVVTNVPIDKGNNSLWSDYKKIKNSETD